MGVESKPTEPNPYNWQGETKHFVGRGMLLNRAMIATLEGEGVFLLLGTRGMGKSVFLAHLEAELLKDPELEILSFSGPPLPAGPVLVVDDILLALLEGLLRCARKRGRAGMGDEFERKLSELTKKRWIRELFEAYLQEFSEQVERIVLIYDELDRYAESPAAGRDYFNALEDVRKKLDKRLVVVAAGGLGMLSLKTVLGSSIFTRVAGPNRKILEPFRGDEIQDLAEPFRKRGVELSPDVLDTLRVLSGGNLALATYGLQSLWSAEVPSPRHLTEAFEAFNNDFGASIRSAIFGFDESEAPVHVWRSLKKTGGRMSKKELASIRRHKGVKSAIENKDILDMLRAGGLIRMEDSAWRADPIIAEIIPSILSFDSIEEQGPLETLKEQLRADLVAAMADIHRMAPAFYRPGSKERHEEKQIVPEAVFAAVLVASLGGRGWKVELEPMSGAGYADIKARYPTRFGEETVIVEVKIWPRQTDTIHDQVKSYFVQGVTALATVVIADVKDPAWKDAYEQQCLKGKADGPSIWRELDRPLEGYFEARWESRVVEHFLLRLPSRS